MSFRFILFLLCGPLKQQNLVDDKFFSSSKKKKVSSSVWDLMIRLYVKVKENFMHVIF